MEYRSRWARVIGPRELLPFNRLVAVRRVASREAKDGARNRGGN